MTCIILNQPSPRPQSNLYWSNLRKILKSLIMTAGRATIRCGVPSKGNAFRSQSPEINIVERPGKPFTSSNASHKAAYSRKSRSWRRGGPTRIGLVMPSSAASVAPRSEVLSHGWTMSIVAGCPSLAGRPWILGSARPLLLPRCGARRRSRTGRCGRNLLGEGEQLIIFVLRRAERDVDVFVNCPC
jgi:hypothetical protein